MAHEPSSAPLTPETRVESDSLPLPGKAERLGYLGMALFLGSLLLAPVDEAEAAQFTVTNTGDNGAGSLRQAVLDANGTGGADEIVFAQGLTGVITLTSGQLDVTDALTVTGPGPAVLAVDGNYASRIFSTAVGGNGSPLTITGLTLEHGNFTGSGGAIYANNNALTIDDCVITGNSCTSAGGGIRFFGNYSYGLTITNSTISGNTSGNKGGGVLAVGADPLYVANSEFNGNVAISGGGLFIEACTPASILYSRIYDNSVTGEGGGVYVYRTDLNVIESTIEANTCQRDGGGLFFITPNAFDLSLENTVVSKNSANRDGGGIAVRVAASVHAIGCTFSDNSCGRDGGGLALYRSSDLMLSGCTLSGNRSDKNGGAASLVSAYDLIIDTCTITGNYAFALDGYPQGGGGLNLDGLRAPCAILSSNILDNYSGFLGGGASIRLQSYAPLTINNSTFEGNYSKDDGGGFYMRNDGNESPVTITQSVFNNNYAGDDGGGLTQYLSGYYSTLTLQSCTVTNNFSGDDGGAISIDADDFNSPVVIDRCRITGNASVENGGGIHFYTNSDGDLQITNSTVSNNFIYSLYSGGGLFFVSDNDGLTIENSTFSNNGAPFGGGVFIGYAGDTVTISNSTVSGNFCLYGGGIFQNRSGTPYSLFLENTTVAYNRAYEAFGGIITLYAIPNIISSIASGNYYGDTFSPIVPAYGYRSLIENPYTPVFGTGNVFYQEAYLEPLANNGGPTRTHALSISSPAIDAGVNAAGSPFDQRGLPFLRTVGAQTDMGAVEFNADDPPPTGLPFGFGADSDDDGFSDDAEIAAGTDPFDGKDTPLGGTSLLSAGDLEPLTVLKYGNVLKFNKPGADTIKVKGRIELPDGTPLASVGVLLDIAGNSFAFTLDEKGGAKTADGKIKVKAPKGGVAQIQATLKGDFRTAFADNADMQDVTTAGEAKIVRVAMTFGDVGAFRADVVVSYKAKQGKSGKAK